MILSIPVPDLKTYRDDPQLVLDRPHACPGCGHRPLARHDTRLRWFYSASEKIRGLVFRMQCAACGATVTLLPDFLVPRFRYIAAVIQQAIAEYLTTPISYRDLAIALSGAPMPDDVSATDALLTIRLRPSYQRIHAWVKHLAVRANGIAQALTTWLLRLRPDSHLLHLLANAIPTFDAKSASPAKRIQLRAAAMLHVFVRQAPELFGPLRTAWLFGLKTMAHRLRGWPSLPDPPST